MNNVISLYGHEITQKKKTKPIKVKTLSKNILKDAPSGMFSMTWDKHGNICYWSTHGENKNDFIRCGLYDFLSFGMRL